MKVELIRHTLRPEETIALGAKLCYSKAVIGDLKDRIEERDQATFIERLLDMGHESVFEHASFTFGVEGVSRVLLAQLTRHRLASFSVQSQRYVSYEKGFGYIIPPAIRAMGPEEEAEYHRQMEQMQRWYNEWQEKLGKRGEGSNEDARFVLPNACETRILMTMNVRELRHFFSLRMCNRAQWEIREMATRMHRLCMETAPALFADAGPACLRGKCPEGEKSCGKAREIRAERDRMLRALRESAAADQT
ncbi:MAG: FAD-dependent thymidylate synthase [Clostridia bacterium]|nr:FAD-dependent thymidylate synthase [Clostridia bacterium]